MQIDDGKGNGTRAGVTTDNHLMVDSVSNPVQHYISHEHGEAYQLIGIDSAVSATTQTTLHIKNNNLSKDMVITYVRLQPVGVSGVSAMPSLNTYYQMGFGTTYSAGGATATSVNVNSESGKVSGVTAYQNGPATTGTFTEIDRWYPKADAEEQRYSKEGAVIVSPGDTFEIRLITNNTAGLSYSRVSYYMQDKEG